MKLYLLLMKKYHYIIILIFIFSCKSKNQSEISWTDKEKDQVFKQCIDYAYTTNRPKWNRFTSSSK